ncbi:hypothetical protein BJV82DRAFT_689269 [Fennellomyces sp. T-0311]|nr:hypothetical protein BJV82DRAFT_689269 [Fennellomyces sp. T-0311]
MPNTFRLDLRILVKAKDGNDLEAAAGEFASKIATMASKLFKDKLKSILVAKHHFNELVCAARYVDTKVLKTIRIPILQIMGTSCFLYSFGLVDKTVYTVQDVDDCVYPATMMQVKKRCHRRPSPAVCQDCKFPVLITMLKELKSFQADYSLDTCNQMANIKSKKGHARLLDTDNWLSPMVYPGDDDPCRHEVDENSEEN